MGHFCSASYFSLITSLLFFIGVSYVPSSAQGNKTPSGGTNLSDAKIVLNIPPGGLTSDGVQEVSLKGSEVLLVVDESGKAVFMPQANENATDEKQEENLNKVVYAVEDGKCNFGKTLTYKQIFPALDASYIGLLWEKTAQSCDGNSQTPPGANSGSKTVTDYIYTSPPPDKLQGKKVSFCVRFYSAGSVTSITTQATTTGSTKSDATASPTPEAPPQTTPAPVTPAKPESSEAGPSASDHVEQNQSESGGKEQASLRALIKRDQILSDRPAREKVDEKANEGTVNVLESGGDKTVEENVPGTYSTRQSSGGEGGAGYYLTVIIHSSSSEGSFGILTSLLVFTSSLSGILRAASFF